MCVYFGGCAAITNPVANGVPVRILSDELLAKSKQDLKPIPLSLLRQQPPAVYRLAAGDILGVYIEGVLGQADQPPPVNIPEGTNLPPAFGYPMPVRQDGRVPVPLVEPVLVDRLTVPEAERAIAKAYGDKRILRPEDRRILVTLMRPRHISVLVLREDSTQRQLAIQSQALRGLPTTQTILGGQQQGSGAVVELAAYENNVLHALAQTGGLPGLEAVDEAIIYRGYWDSASGSPLVPGEEPRGYAEVKADSAQKTIRIPMRMRPGEPLPFNPQDAILQTGDIVVVRAMEPQFYYTGGLLPARTDCSPPRHRPDGRGGSPESARPTAQWGLRRQQFERNADPVRAGQPFAQSLDRPPQDAQSWPGHDLRRPESGRERSPREYSRPAGRRPDPARDA